MPRPASFPESALDLAGQNQTLGDSQQKQLGSAQGRGSVHDLFWKSSRPVALKDSESAHPAAKESRGTCGSLQVSRCSFEGVGTRGLLEDLWSGSFGLRQPDRGPWVFWVDESQPRTQCPLNLARTESEWGTLPDTQLGSPNRPPDRPELD